MKTVAFHAGVVVTISAVAAASLVIVPPMLVWFVEFYQAHELLGAFLGSVFVLGTFALYAVAPPWRMR
jgi:hypothetical protein